MRRHARYGIAAVAALMLTLPLTSMPAGAAQVTGAGSAGIGDPYYPDYGNGGYDVSHYDLRLRYDPVTDHLQGTATLLAKATEELDSFNLDFALTVSSVRVNNRVAAFAAEGPHELVVTPAAALTAGQNLTIVVEYSGTPSEVEVYGFTSWARTPDGAVASNEPEVAWWWYPSNDHPLDKATFDISVLVPEGTSVVSNGMLTGTSPEPAGVRWSWRETKPMATYLALLVVGDFEVRTDTTDSGLPVVTAYSNQADPASIEAAKASVERTPEVIDWASDLFGPYPFDAVGGVVPNVTFRFSVEDQTRPMFSPHKFEQGSNMYLVTHENAHQWFGDSVSVAGWRNIWLNEGFASYAEWLWSETHGEGSAQEVFDYTYASIPADDEFWQVKVGDPGPENQFDGAIYDRGAMCLHMLRNAVGDDVFFDILRGWTADHRYGNGTIEEFIALAEERSGQDLGELFDTWLFTPGKPALDSSAAARIAGGPVRPASWTKLRQAAASVRAPR